MAIPIALSGIRKTQVNNTTLCDNTWCGYSQSRQLLKGLTTIAYVGVFRSIGEISNLFYYYLVVTHTVYCIAREWELFYSLDDHDVTHLSKV